MDSSQNLLKQEEIAGQTVYYKSSENMDELPSESIDTIITSPPYNVGKSYSGDSNDKYNDKMEFTDYIKFLTRVWDECYRVLKPTGVFFLNIGDSAKDQGKSELVAQSVANVGFVRIQTIIWIKSILGKGHYTPTGGKRRLNNVWEYIFMFAKDPKRYQINPLNIGVPYADKSNIGRYSDQDLKDPGDAWFIPYSQTTGATIKKGHDAPFPVELPLKCIKLAEAKTVLDPFGGTCTTLQACHYLGVKGFAYEKYPRKKLIRQTIIDLENVKEQPIILLPHLERSVLFLMNLLEKTELSPVQLEELLKGKTGKISKKTKIKILELVGVLKGFDYTGNLLDLIEQYSKIDDRSPDQSSKEFKRRKLSEFLK